MMRTKENLNKSLSKALKTKGKPNGGFWETTRHSGTQGRAVGAKLNREKIRKKKICAWIGTNVDPNLNRNTKTYIYNHKYRDATKKHFISLIQKYWIVLTNKMEIR